VVPIFFGMVGYIIAATTLSFAARYISLFLMLAGIYGSYNVALAWISSTLPQPIEKRAAAIALVNENTKLAAIEIQTANGLAAEKATVEEIVDVSSPGGMVALAPGFRYSLGGSSCH
jgi:hypothetical protein